MASKRALSDEQVASYQRDGYVIARGLFDRAETAALYDTAKADLQITDNAMSLPDGEGRLSKITLWNHPADDIYGMVARSERMVESMSRLLDDEVYHYHSKLMLKEPEVGGAWMWHQDYGYWYQNGCLYPLMSSCFISIDRASRENGCLQILKGSHLMGRLEHTVEGGQLTADPEHVEAAKGRHELVHVEMEPGDGAFFHCNLLHCSAQNRSANPRWTLICCYNARRNDPYKASQHPGYTPLVPVDDSMVMAYADRASAADQEFMSIEDDVSDERSAMRRAAESAKS
ncbi:MAG: phytanoyl-CoA dioxygenase family protein [Pseudomonadota bacterium]